MQSCLDVEQEDLLVLGVLFLQFWGVYRHQVPPTYAKNVKKSGMFFAFL